eukprot:CAMPEP_0172468710 /NCGR_PEP_ID=MMETSP1065-20121228/61926_1 /TAXON_ID=265537 /ORGANISM="Amphiprora paludosa, Strain CCMP125" /LENGTH=196 /DNA_ID=CAMNT_0013226161 /DNA_START=292 /DNA_END=882 /DNA_ORIENTATION=+
MATLDVNHRIADDDEEDVPITGFGRSRNSMILKNKQVQGASTADTLAASEDFGSESLKVTKQEPVEDHEPTAVKFNTVRVHKHRMTLGAHPDTKGIPVTLAWDVEESQEFDLDTYDTAESNKNLKILTKTKREEIVGQNHTRSSITKIQSEMKDIRISREAGKHENLRKAELHEEKQKKREKGVMGLFRRRKDGRK